MLLLPRQKIVFIMFTMPYFTDRLLLPVAGAAETGALRVWRSTACGYIPERRGGNGFLQSPRR